MEIIFIVSVFLYLILHVIFLFGYLRSSSLKQNPDNLNIKISVIVAARNEENIISNCIESLKNLHYEKSLLEIFLVNDKSTDRTKEIMLESTKGYPEFIVLDSDNTETKNLKGKANAIDSAVKSASGDIILMTDADCNVPPGWVKETVKYFLGNVEMVCGFTKINYKNSMFAKLQALDWIYLQALASCSSGIGSILSCIGNNLTFSKKVYNEIGGYSSINFSVTEDLALMRRINSDSKYKVIYPVNPECAVLTEECKTVKELYNQKKRWFKGGLGINFLGWILGFDMYAVNLMLVAGLFFLNPLMYLLLIFIKFISELMIMIPVHNKLKFKGVFTLFPIFQLYFAAYGLLLPLTFLLGTKISWKERKH
ncbi:MAG: glycosyltransferase [Ignavibacteriae bacterium]|nr:glycosyltransferase [Ignavibacteriota bacterium]